MFSQAEYVAYRSTYSSPVSINVKAMKYQQKIQAYIKENIGS